MGNPDRGEQGKKMRQTRLNLSEMYFQISTGLQDGNMTMFSFALKRTKEKEGEAPSPCSFNTAPPLSIEMQKIKAI